jgi:hypothetical protein
LRFIKEEIGDTRIGGGGKAQRLHHGDGNRGGGRSRN